MTRISHSPSVPVRVRQCIFTLALLSARALAAPDPAAATAAATAATPAVAQEPGRAEFNAAYQLVKDGALTAAIPALRAVRDNKAFSDGVRIGALTADIAVLARTDPVAAKRRLSEYDDLGVQDLYRLNGKGMALNAVKSWPELEKVGQDLEVFSVSTGAYFRMLSAQGQGDQTRAAEHAKRGLLSGTYTGPATALPMWRTFVAHLPQIAARPNGIQEAYETVQRILIAIPDGDVWTDFRTQVNRKLADFK